MSTVNNTIELAPSDGKITSVTVMHLRAEVVKSFKLAVKKGQNKAHIQWLPGRIVRDSLRVEGKGKGTIQDVKLLDNTLDGKETSPELEALHKKRHHLEKSIERCQGSIESLKTYLGSLNAQYTNADNLSSVLTNYEKAAAEQDIRLFDLEQQKKELDEEIKKEKQRIAPSNPEKRGLQAAVGIFVDGDTEVELVLKYAVSQANWNAAYDIRVDTNAEEKNVKLIYKANVFQKTGESWDGVPLTLETITPTFGVALPTLNQWNVSIAPPPPPPKNGQPAQPDIAEEEDDDVPGFGLFDHEEPGLEPPPPAAVSKGGLSATYKLPGTVSIHSGDGESLFTIVEMELDAVMNWYGVPRVDSGVHLKAKIQNMSDCVLIPGNANVYVDGSFISTSCIPLVGPYEHFDCALGVDPSVKTTYHPIQKTVTMSGFYNRTTNTAYTQRITVKNTRLTSVPLLRIADQIPVSDSTQVLVKLVTPALTTTTTADRRNSILPLPTPNIGASPSQPSTPLPTPYIASTSSTSSQLALTVAEPAGEVFTTINLADTRTETRTETPPPPPTENPSLIRSELLSTNGPTIQVAENVWALWHGANSKNAEGEVLGKDGKVDWLCEVPPQETLDLMLKWEVSRPTKFELEFSRRPSS